MNLKDVQWIILQLQTIDEDSPAWQRAAEVLKGELKPNSDDPQRRNPRRLQYDSSSDNVHRVHTARGFTV